jgi:hypothetical protein
MKRPLILALACAALMGMTSSQAPRIPLVKDLMVVEAWRGGPTQGDYESSTHVDAVDERSVTLTLRAKSLGLEIDTRMARTTMRDARTYRQIWTSADPEVIAGATSMMVSSALRNELATKGIVKMTILPRVGTSKSGTMLGQMSMLANAVLSDSTSPGTPYTETVRRIEPAAVPFSLLINGHPSSVAAIHARGIIVAEGDSIDTELYILDDPSLPIVLQSGAVGEVYDIYFDYNEATITPQSNVALRDIADIMRRHPDWRLDIVGHTDSIGGSGAGNMALSARRGGPPAHRDELDAGRAREKPACRAAAAVMAGRTTLPLDRRARRPEDRQATVRRRHPPTIAASPRRESQSCRAIPYPWALRPCDRREPTTARSRSSRAPALPSRSRSSWRDSRGFCPMGHPR